jgi:tetratricopeptide (TPR) repeat protein
MHRLRQITAALMLCGVLGAGGCASGLTEVPDPPQVETLRLKIAKVRNAISETRRTIADSRGATYLPELYVRLAELMSEEARYHYQLAYEREQRATKVLHVPQVRLLKEKSIETYELVLSRFPDSELAPRVLFNIGHEWRELGEFDKMRGVLQRLVDNYEDSPLRYDALLVLGDYHFDRNQLGQSKGYYEKITKGPLLHVTGLGHYKLAWVWVNLGECKDALSEFERAIERSNRWEEALAERAAAAADDDEDGENPSDVDGLTERPNNSPIEGAQQDIDVRRESLVDLAYCYSRERSHKKVVRYVEKYAYDRPTYVAALDKMASRYRVMDNFEGAVLVSRELLRLGDASEDRLEDARALYTSLKKLRRYDDIDDDMALIAEALVRRYSRFEVNAEQRGMIVTEFEQYGRDLAISAQKRLVKIKKARDKRRFADRLAAAYAIYFDTFPEGPQRSDMLLNMADVLLVANRELDSGLRSLEASNLLRDEAERQTALYDAIVSFQASMAKESNRSQYERVTARAALRRAADQLLKFELEPDKARRVKYAVAQTYYDEGRFALAIDKLTAVAYEYPNSEEADASLQLVLDSYNTLNDNDGLIMASRRFMAEASPASAPLKAKIKGVLAAAETRKLDELSLQAAGDEGGDLTPLIEFAASQKGTSLGERALINAFVAARAIGDTSKMYELADELAKTYPASEQLPGIFTTLAQTAIARFEYDRAVDILGRAASLNSAQRTQLVTSTGQLLEQLGRAQEAEKLYMSVISSSEGPARAEALGSLAVLLERQGNAQDMARKLQPYADDGNPELLARLGLALVAQGDRDNSEMMLQSVLDAGSAATPEAQARAHYGMAEVLLETLKIYPDPTDVDLIQEFIAIVEVTQQSYLNAARQGSPEFAAAALSRLAFSMRYAAERIGKIPMPDGLDAAGKDTVRRALEARVTQLRALADEALGACAQQVWQSALLNDVVVGCLKGEPLGNALVPFDSFSTRAKGVNEPKGIDKLRDQLSKNPEDIERLRALGEAFLDAGDPHVARLIFARALQLGGGPTEQNLLGIASFQIGDRAGAYSSFSQAASGGLEAGRKNMIFVLGEAGLGSLEGEVREKIASGKPGGRLLN